MSYIFSQFLGYKRVIIVCEYSLWVCKPHLGNISMPCIPKKMKNFKFVIKMKNPASYFLVTNFFQCIRCFKNQNFMSYERINPFIEYLFYGLSAKWISQRSTGMFLEARKTSREMNILNGKKISNKISLTWMPNSKVESFTKLKQMKLFILAIPDLRLRVCHYRLQV